MSSTTQSAAPSDLTFSEVISVVRDVVRSAEIAGIHSEETRRRRRCDERRIQALRTTMEILRAAEQHPDFAEFARGAP